MIYATGEGGTEHYDRAEEHYHKALETGAERDPLIERLLNEELAGEHDIDVLFMARAEALDDPDLRTAVGARGRQRVIDQWSWRHTASKTVDQYRALLNDHAERTNR